jgi:hypothetical protein
MGAVPQAVIDEARRTFDVPAQCVMLSLLDLEPDNASALVGASTNPVIWQVGHLAAQQDFTFHRTNGGAGVLSDELRHWFRWGSNPREELSQYPAFAEVVDAYVEVTAASQQLLARATAEQWSEPRSLPDGKLMAGGETLLELVRRVALHHIYHVGCITAIRKELGDKCPRGFIPGMSPEALAKQQARFDAFWQAHRTDYL